MVLTKEKIRQHLQIGVIHYQQYTNKSKFEQTALLSIQKVIMLARRGFQLSQGGWHYKHWKRTFYPTNIKAAEQFECYARHFPTVELNNSFFPFFSDITIEMRYELQTILTDHQWEMNIEKLNRKYPTLSFELRAEKIDQLIDKDILNGQHQLQLNNIPTDYPFRQAEYFR